MSNCISWLKIEPLSADNLLPFAKLAIELWPESSLEDELLSWATMINSSNNYCVLAKSGKGYIGFMHISQRNDYVEGSLYDRTAYLEGVYVKSDYRNKGVGKILVAHGEEWAKAKGLKQLASDTEIDNFNSQRFHDKLGFKEANRIVCFVKNV